MSEAFRRPGILFATAAVLVVVGVAVARLRLEAQRPPAVSGVARVNGHPDLSGLWQTMNQANWDLEAHNARPAAITQKGYYEYEYSRVPAAAVLALGAAGIVPASQGVVEGDGKIPYKPEALARKRENAEHWVDRDPELKCFLPGVPRAIYQSPFQIVQGASKIEMVHEFTNAGRTINLDPVAKPLDISYMGQSLGRWEGETLVVTTTELNDKTWLDRAGNFHSDKLKVTERFTPKTADSIWYEATLEDPDVFTRPWKLSMALYRRLEPNAQLMENRCVDLVEEFLYGGLRRTPLVTHWESATMVIDLKRRMPEKEKLYEWYGR